MLGQLFLDPATGPFEIVDDLVEAARMETHVIVVDIHAEATSEKVALARWLDGRVTAAVNTILEPEQDHEAKLLARQIVAGLESGELEPTAAAIEPLADRLPS